MEKQKFDLKKFCLENGLNIEQTATAIGFTFDLKEKKIETLADFIRNRDENPFPVSDVEVEIFRTVIKETSSITDFKEIHEAVSLINDDRLLEVFDEIIAPFARTEWGKMKNYEEMKILHNELTDIINDDLEDEFREAWLNFMTSNEEAKYLWKEVLCENMTSPKTPLLLKKWASFSGYIAENE